MARGERKARCGICGRELPSAELIPADTVREPIVSDIRADHPGWRASGLICARDLNHYRTLHVQHELEAERGELSSLETEVLTSIREEETLARDINTQFDRELTLGERVADRMAEFGGSWRFILSFCMFLVLWIVANSALLVGRPWDPYPFILLNLLLSCVAALQAPIIMMSQNRQEAKDRLRAQNDYRVNLKAELEIRSLHAKLDLLLSHQWQRLLEIQEIQTEMMEQLGAQQSSKRERR